MQLRWYQSEGIAAIFNYFLQYSGNPIGAFPTGTGKSLIIAKLLQQIFCTWPGQRVMMLTHVKELIAQNFAELVEAWPTAPAGIFSAGLGRKEVRPIVFAGIKSVVGRGSLFGHIDLVLIDECHLVSPADDTAYESFLDELRAINPKVKVIGFTATPYRLGQGLLTEHTTREGKIKPPIFTDICYDVTGVEAFNRLIAEGHLCNLVPKQTGTKIDVSHVAVRGGEFVQGELQKAVDRDEITYAAIQETIQLASDRKHWLVFATGIRHCEHVTTMLDSCGISAVAVHSKSGSDRDKAVADFKAGRVRALVNPVLFTVGFNFPAIDCIVDLAPTSSPSRHVQKYGRGTRPFPGKADCLVLDFAGNTRRNGPINDPVIPKKRRAGARLEIDESRAPVKLCGHCATWNHSSVRFCTNCKEEFPPPDVKIEAEASTDALIVGEAPKLEICKVERVEYRKHTPHFMSGKPSSLVINVHSGFRMFSEWICLEHEGYAAKRAREWWRTAADDADTEPPATIDDALRCLEVLQRPSHVRVWMNTKTPKIMAYDYSGTAFGSHVPAAT